MIIVLKSTLGNVNYICTLEDFPVLIRYRYFKSVFLEDNDKSILRHYYHGYGWLVVASSLGIKQRAIIFFTQAILRFPHQTWGKSKIQANIGDLKKTKCSDIEKNPIPTSCKYTNNIAVRIYMQRIWGQQLLWMLCLINYLICNSVTKYIVPNRKHQRISVKESKWNKSFKLPAPINVVFPHSIPVNRVWYKYIYQITTFWATHFQTFTIFS